jgi:hypothetical protein
VTAKRRIMSGVALLKNPQPAKKPITTTNTAAIVR